MVKVINNSNISVGSQSVVLLPLAEYERMQEDLAMLRSKTLGKKVAEARQQKKQNEALNATELRESFKTLTK